MNARQCSVPSRFNWIFTPTIMSMMGGGVTLTKKKKPVTTPKSVNWLGFFGVSTPPPSHDPCTTSRFQTPPRFVSSLRFSKFYLFREKSFCHHSCSKSQKVISLIYLISSIVLGETLNASKQLRSMLWFKHQSLI